MRRGLSLVVAVVLLLVAAVAPAAAAKPEIVVDEFEESFVDEHISPDCGFDVTLTVVGRVMHKVWTDAGGEVTRELHNLNVTLTWSANGKSLTARDAGVDRVVFHENGSFTVNVVGNLQLLTVPGEGVVHGSTGRTVLLITPVLDEEGNPVFDEEGNQVFDVEVLAESGISGAANPDHDEICAYLAA